MTSRKTTGTGYPVETVALSVFNMLSRARRPLTASEVRTLLAQPHVWDTRVTQREVERGVKHLASKGWIVKTGPALDLADRHPVTLFGRDVVRDPTDPRGAKLLMLGAYQ